MKREQGIVPLLAWIRRGALLLVLIGLPLLLFTSLKSSAQEERKPQNLKVLPKTIAHDSLIAIMSKFSMALGVNCDYCHARAESGRELDFASDAKKTKQTARDMLQMVSKINGTYLADLPTGDEPRVNVECFTCHRGQQRPMLLQDVLKLALEKHGIGAVDSTYRDLREQYYGSGTFDFSDYVLAFLALDIAHDNAGNAMDILKLNGEFNPKSATNSWAMGHVYALQGDTAQAVSSYKLALAINPNYRRAQHDLQMLQGGGRGE